MGNGMTLPNESALHVVILFVLHSKSRCGPLERQTRGHSSVVNHGLRTKHSMFIPELWTWMEMGVAVFFLNIAFGSLYFILLQALPELYKDYIP